MTTNKNKKNSTARKIIPAAGMLAVSALMLSSATYAWFTMSREVEVTGIKMTAVVPEDLQIALGDENIAGTKLLSTNGHDDGTGTGDAEYSSSTTYQMFNTTVKAPTVSANTNDWHNTVDFSRFYTVARLNPASSTDGNYLFKTADATSKGETVSNTAKFEALTLPVADDKKDMAALYVNDAPSEADLASKANSGYYVDFPVWFRTSSYTVDASGLVNSTDKTLELGVKAVITQNTGTEAEEDLYHAVRIAVLPTTGSWDATTTVANTGGTITGVIHDGFEKVTDSTTDPVTKQKYYDRYNADNSELTSAMVRQAIQQPGTLVFDPSTNEQTNVNDIYGTADIVKQATTLSTVANETTFYADGEAVVHVPLATAQNNYGTPVKYIIRVWIEGEDEFCWNPTAGQDFNVSLQFVKLDTTGSHAAPTAEETTYKGDASSNTIVATPQVATTTGDTITIKSGSDTLGTYTVGTGYVGDGVTSVLDATTISGKGRTTYKLADGTVIGNSTDLANYIIRNVGKLDMSTITLNVYIESVEVVVTAGDSANTYTGTIPTVAGATYQIDGVTVTNADATLKDKTKTTAGTHVVSVIHPES